MDGYQPHAVASLKERVWTRSVHCVKKLEWPRDLQEKYQGQEQIGWTPMFYGRIAKCWNQHPSEDGDNSRMKTQDGCIKL